MPMDRSKYPVDWEAISQQAREQAGFCCQQCGAPHRTLICRDVRNPEHWWPFDETVHGDSEDDDFRVVEVVLTCAHIDHDVTNNDPDNLAVWCQLHHLRHDIGLHVANAAATRRRKRVAAGQLEMAGVQ